MFFHEVEEVAPLKRILIIFRHSFNIGGKSFTQRERILNSILPIAFTFVHVFHQIVAHLPQKATELVRFLITLKIWAFLKK